MTMKLLNLKAYMRIQNRFSGGVTGNRRSRTGLMSAAPGREPTSTGMAGSWPLLLCLGWLVWPAAGSAQPTNYADEHDVAGYVRTRLYWPDAAPADRNAAAFRYKHLLYVDNGGIRPNLTNMANLYADPERQRA